MEHQLQPRIINVTVSAANIAPTVTTSPVSSVASTSATGNGNITTLGAPNPTSYGICWNTTGTPTTANSKVDNGGSFRNRCLRGFYDKLNSQHDLLCTCICHEQPRVRAMEHKYHLPQVQHLPVVVRLQHPHRLLFQPQPQHLLRQSLQS